MPPAARIADMHVCPMVNPGPVPHVGGPEISGSPNVIVGFMPQGRVGDSLICVPAVDKIAMGSTTVLVNNKQAARIGDPTAHGGKIVAGCPTVIIGDSGQGSAFKGASATGAPFCEECEKAKKAAEEAAKVQATAPPPNAPPMDSIVVTPDQAKALSDPKALVAALAKQKNASPDDGLNAARRAARWEVAFEFYKTEAAMAPARIGSHINAIDLDKPVEIAEFNAGDTLLQRGFPVVPPKKNKNGQYFTLDPKITPEQVGAYSSVLVDGPPKKVVPRDFREMTVSPGKTIKGLKTTAAAVDDTWSMSYDSQTVTDKDEKVTSLLGTDGNFTRPREKDPDGKFHHRKYAVAKRCEGGGEQVMIPSNAHHHCTTKVV